MLHHFRQAAHVGGDHRHLGGHRLQRGQSERFDFAGQQKQIAQAEFFLDLVLLAHEKNVLRKIFLAHDVFRGAAIGTVAHHHQLRRNLLPHLGENLHHIGDPLHRAKIGKVHQNRLVILGPFLPRRAILGAFVQVAVHEIGDHFDVPLDFEFVVSLLAQVFRNRSHPVALLDGKPGDRQVTAVVAHHRNIGAVQGSDERQFLGRRHHPRQQRAHRMRNRVVHVEQVQRLRLRHLDHLRRQRQRIRGMIEQRVSRHLHLMKIDPFVMLGQPDRHGIADEVHLMPPCRQLDTEFGSHHARTAVRGIAGDSDFHGPSWLRDCTSRHARAATRSLRLRRQLADVKFSPGPVVDALSICVNGCSPAGR